MSEEEVKKEKEEVISELDGVPYEFYKKIRDKEFNENERRILDLLFKGLKYDEIAESVGVAKSYISYVRKKLAKKWGKVSKEEETPSTGRATSTFKFLDRSTVELLRPVLGNLRGFNEAIYEIGILGLWVAFQVGKLSPEDVVDYGEKLVKDPKSVYDFVSTQLRSLVMAAKDTEAMGKLVARVKELERDVRVLEFENEFLTQALTRLKQYYSVALSLMSREQINRLLTNIALQELFGGELVGVKS